MSSSLLFAGLPGLSFAADLQSFPIDNKDFLNSTTAEDEKYWNKIATKYYDVSPNYINLENGYYGIQPKPI